MGKVHQCENVCVEHYDEHELKCPYCLAEGSDSFEVIMGGHKSGTTECGYCDKEYEYATTITYREGGVHSISYETFQIDNSKNEGE